jgi:preprotein translocase subunit SecB
MTNGGPQAQVAMPQIGVLAQYVKDFSFENPNAPRSMAPSAQQPAINVQVNVDAAQMTETDFEVTLNAAVRRRTDLCRCIPHPKRPAG